MGAFFLNLTLVAHTPEPEKTVAAAAKLCYSSSGAMDLLEGLDEQKTQSFVQMLADIGHESPLEHAVFTFAVEGISRACSHQLVRHRIASYSQKSQRYVDEENFDYIIPPEIELVPQACEEFRETMNLLAERYQKIAEILTQKHKESFMALGISEKEATSKARKKANEDARFILPNACETKIVITMNARSLLNFFRHRCCNRAQWEIKAVADEMLRLCCEVAPSLFTKAGPLCAVSGKCPEGKMSCGQILKMKEFYEELKKNKGEKPDA